MFEHIAEDFQWRLKDLKSELEKRLDIRYKNESNNESDNESEDESIKKILELKPGMWVNAIYQEKKN